jgi:hypothetical protein
VIYPQLAASENNLLKGERMQYTPIYVLKGYRVTETYRFGEITYEVEIEVQSQGWSSGMAGYDPHTVALNISTSGQQIGTVFVSFPLTKKTGAVRYVYGDLEKPRFTEQALTGLYEAVSAFLDEQRLYASIGRELKRFSYRIC